MVSLPCKRDTNVRATTKRNFYNINFTWAIERFSLYPDKIGGSIKSPFFGGDGEDKIWQLELYPGGKHKDYKDHVSLYLNCKTANLITTDFKIKIEDYEGSLVSHIIPETEKNPQTTASTSHQDFGVDKAWGYRKFVERKKLFGTSEKLLPNDTLTVVCSLKVYLDPTDHVETRMAKLINEDPSTNFLGDLYDTKKLSDVIFIVKGKTFDAHKCVLASCSAVFEAMFTNEMKEKETSEVKIDDVEANVFTEILRFVYTGKVEKPEVLASDLLFVADKYDLKNLKIYSQQEMLKNLNVETAVKYLVLSDLHSCDPLKQEVIEYISRHSTGVVKTDGWKQMIKSYPHLVAEIFEYQNQ